MKASDVRRYTYGVCAAAVLTGCGIGSGTQLSPSTEEFTAEPMHLDSTLALCVNR